MIKRISIGQQVTKIAGLHVSEEISTSYDGKVTVWAAVSYAGVIGPFIVNQGWGENCQQEPLHASSAE
jgi:hypothetical protein